MADGLTRPQDFLAEFAAYDPYFNTYDRLEPSCPSSHVASNEVGVLLVEWGDEAAPLQQAAWEYLVANAGAVEEALKQKMRSIQANSLAMHGEEMRALTVWRSIRSKIQSQLPSGAEEAIDQFYKLVGINLAPTGLDECCFVGFAFQTAWVKDHGLEVVMHKDRVLARGGMTELRSPNRSIVELIKSTQEYDLDPGDFRLP